jgi:hypothetical protein
MSTPVSKSMTRVGQAAVIVLCAGMAFGAASGPPHAAGGEGPSRMSAPMAAPSAPHSGGGGMSMSHSGPSGPMRMSMSGAAPSSSRSIPMSALAGGSNFRSQQMFAGSRGGGMMGRPMMAGDHRHLSEGGRIVRPPRSGSTIMSIPSGVESARRAAALSPSSTSISRSLASLPSSPSIGIRLPSGADSVGALSSTSRPLSDVRAPAAALASMRVDAAGAPARSFGTSGNVATGSISGHALDAGAALATTSSHTHGSGNHNHGDHGGHDHGDHHHHDGHNNVVAIGIGPGYTYPYAYYWGGPWYTNYGPGSCWGYQTPFYAWQCDTTPIYQWDTSPSYSTAWCPDVWAWRDCLNPTATTFVNGGGYSLPSAPFVVGDAGVFGGSPGSVLIGGVGDIAPESMSINAEQKRADARLLSRINTQYDVLPDFGSTLEATAAGDYSASIYAMRRAAGVNPGALMGTGTPASSAIQADASLAQRVQMARQIFQNPPQKIVSEVDAHFMVGALSSLLGDTQTAQAELSAAQAAGDVSTSTELLLRAVRGDNLNPDAIGQP